MSLKRKWSEFEDIQLYELIRIFGTQRWPEIGDLMPGRTGRQCRERWNHRLNPNLVKGNWSEEEDSIILREKDNFGGSWAKLSRLLPGRNDNDIRNRYFALTRNPSSNEEANETSKGIAKKQISSAVADDDDNDKLSEGEDISKSKMTKEIKLKTGDSTDFADATVEPTDSKVEVQPSKLSDSKSHRKVISRDIKKLPQLKSSLHSREDEKDLNSSILEIQTAKLKELERKRALSVLFNSFSDNVNSKKTKQENGQYPLPNGIPSNYPLMSPHFMSMANGFNMQGMVPPVSYMMGNNAAAGGSPSGMMSQFQYGMPNQQNVTMMGQSPNAHMPMHNTTHPDYAYYGQW